MPTIHVADPDDDQLADYRNVPDAELVARRGIFIGKFFGIEFYLDYSWFFIVALVIYTLSSAVFPEALRGLESEIYLIMGASGALLVSSISA